MANNPKAKDNLRPFAKGVSGNPNGRPRSLSKAIKDIPEDARREIFGVLYHAITLNNENEAREYLESIDQGDQLGRYGFVLQIAIKALMGPNGWVTLNDIIDRLFGKARQTQEIELSSKPESPGIQIVRTYIQHGDGKGTPVGPAIIYDRTDETPTPPGADS